MAGRSSRSAQEITSEIQAERLELARAVESLRSEADLTGAVRAKLPLLAAGALGAGFVLAGGVGATMRLLARRGREGRRRAQVGRFLLVER